MVDITNLFHLVLLMSEANLCKTWEQSQNIQSYFKCIIFQTKIHWLIVWLLSFSFTFGTNSLHEMRLLEVTWKKKNIYRNIRRWFRVLSVGGRHHKNPNHHLRTKGTETVNGQIDNYGSVPYQEGVTRVTVSWLETGITRKQFLTKNCFVYVASAVSMLNDA